MMRSGRTSTLVPPDEVLRAELSMLARQAVTGLLGELGRPIVHLEEVDPARELWPSPIAVIGFHGDRISGSLMVSAASQLLAATHPAPTGEEDELADWSCELANLTLGALKARLCARGVSFAIGLPTSIGVGGLRVTTSCPRPIGHRFAGGTWPLMIALDVAVSPDLRLVPPAPTPADDLLPALWF